jgi:UDP-3-O-[3-hydroxymyristoyl] N-acetylglucosamine deacetylase
VTTGPIRLEGFALHAGSRASVELAPHDGPVLLARGARRARLEELSVTGTDAAVRVTDGRDLDIELVEHFLAALGGLGIREGIVASVEGPEFPLLDGGARTFADALATMHPGSAPPALRVARAGTLDFGRSSYAFDVGSTVELSVAIDFSHPAIGRQEATWSGGAADFRERIASARTFGFATDGPELAARERAKLCWSTDPAAREAARAVVVYGSASIASADPPPGEDEAARHKLLDLIGDLALYGGPPKGSIRAARPGHAATHHIVHKALLLGLLSR